MTTAGQRTRDCFLEPLVRMFLPEAQNAETGSVALLGVRSFLHDDLDELGR